MIRSPITLGSLAHFLCQWVAALVVILPLACHAGNYRFVKIADDANGFIFFENPSINSNGVVTFVAEKANGDRGIYTSTNGGAPLLLRAENGNPYQFKFGDNLSTNNAGQVAVSGKTTATPIGIFRITTGSDTTVAPNNVATVGANEIPAMNAQGTIAFYGRSIPGNAPGLYRVANGVCQNIVTEESPSTFFATNLWAFTDDGTAYFRAQQTGTQGYQIFRATSGGQPESLLKSDAASAYSSLNSLDANNGGTVVAEAGLRASGKTAILRKPHGAAPAIFAETGPGPNDFFSVSFPQINNNGKVIFLGSINGAASGCFDGPNPQTDAVVQTGDFINGKLMVELHFGREALNEQGHVAFWYRVAGNKYGIALAIPGPSGPPPPEGEITIGASTKTEVPGAGDVGSRWPDGATWESFGEPAIDDASAIAFLGRIKLPPRTTGPRSGIFRKGAGVPSVVAAVGDPVGLIADTAFFSFGEPLLAGDGGLLFEATVKRTVKPTTTQKALFYQPSAGAALQLVTQVGDDVAGTGGAKIFSWKGIAIWPGGKVGLLGRLKPGKTPKVTGANDEFAAVWSPGGALDAALIEGQALAGSFVKKFHLFLAGAGSTGQDRGWFGVWAGETGGRVMAAVTLKTNQVLLGTVGAAANPWQALVGNGPTGPALPSVPAGTNFTALALPSFAPDSKGVVFRATLSDRSTGLYRRNLADGNSSVVARLDNPLPNVALAKVAGYGDPICSPDGKEVQWMGLISIPATRGSKKVQAVQASTDGTLRVVAHAGGTAMGTESQAKWKSFQQIAIAPDTIGGQGVIMATLAGVSGKIDQGLWIEDADQNLHVLLREGQAVGNTTLKAFYTLRAVTGQVGVGRSINYQAQVAVRLATADGVQHVGFVELPAN